MQGWGCLLLAFSPFQACGRQAAACSGGSLDPCLSLGLVLVGGAKRIKEARSCLHLTQVGGHGFSPGRAAPLRHRPLYLVNALKREEVVGGEKRGPACHRSPSAEPKTEKR